MNSELPERIKELAYIVKRNVFILTNFIIVVVVGLLYVFGDSQSAFFLGIILTLNVSLGLFQDMRAWFALARLQLLTAPHVTRVKDDHTTESILFSQVKNGDVLQLAIGDQIPCDGVLLDVSALELNEGLITGESSSLPRSKGDTVLAGSIITAGSGHIKTSGVYSESRIARMTDGIKSYAVKQSPIQYAVQRVIVLSGYVLVLAVSVVALRGYLLHQPNILIVKQIGALASTLVPQGLAFSMTLLFAYGAAHLFKRNVLLQEVNATEKLGHIKNLCMDKTGTLTENVLTVEQLLFPNGVTKEDAERAASLYIGDGSDSSQTVTAIRAFIPRASDVKVIEKLPFSSWRSFGAVLVEEGGVKRVVVAGAPENLLAHIPDKNVSAWLSAIIENESKQGKRVFCIAEHATHELPKQLSDTQLTPIAVFIFTAKLRDGVREAVDFFQKRDVRIRIISGDHPETVRAIAMRAGIAGCEHVITGSEMATWSIEDFNSKAKSYNIFARTQPEQKEKIIEALKHDGFTAMIGDGANDALAIKKADLGIAMWEGAPATRGVASVVLMKNSFTALPGGVELADSIIKNAAIFASIFFAFSFTSLFLLLLVVVLGYPFPLTPLNLTLINYFTIGIPGILVSYWTIRPAGKIVVSSGENFLKFVLPYVVWSALLQAIAIAVIFLISPEAMKQSGSNLLVIFATIITGYIFFVMTPRVYRGKLETQESVTLIAVTVIEVILLISVFYLPLALRFFEVVWQLPSMQTIYYSIVTVVLYAIVQYFLARVYRVKE